MYGKKNSLFPCSQPSKPKRTPVEEIVHQFDLHMRTSPCPKRGSDIEVLINWYRLQVLNWSSGWFGKALNDSEKYSYFCEVAKLLTKKGYETNNPLSKVDFENEITKLEQQDSEIADFLEQRKKNEEKIRKREEYSNQQSSRLPYKRC